MAKKKRKRRPAPGNATQTGPPPSAGASAARREKKEAARLQRERAAKAQVRRGAVRRGLIGGLVGLLVFVGISWFTNRAPAAKPYPQTAIDAGLAASCADLQTPEVSPTNAHHPADEITYSQHPATAGDHDPTPLDGQPRIYTTPVVEARAVHSLEHGSVIMYYRASGEPGGLPQPVIDALGPIATSSRATYLIPYPDLPTGTALAYTAWNKLVTCPKDITPDQAKTIASGFVDAFACSNNAPEGKNGDGC
jgi:hypothetical protein